MLLNYQRRISEFECALSSGSPKATVFLHQVTLALHEAYIRFSDLDLVRNTQLYISKDVCKAAAWSVLYAIESLRGNTSAVPTYIFAKPVHCLILVCKLFRFLKLAQYEWAHSYAEKVDVVMSSFVERGSILAECFCGKAAHVLRWCKEADIAITDSPQQAIQWFIETREMEEAQLNMDVEFQKFLEYFSRIFTG